MPDQTDDGATPSAAAETADKDAKPAVETPKITLRALLTPDRAARCDPRVLDYALSPRELAKWKQLNLRADVVASSPVGEAVPEITDAELAAHIRGLLEDSGDPSAMPPPSPTYNDRPRRERLQWPASDIRKSYRERLFGQSEPEAVEVGSVELSRIDSAAIETLRGAADPAKFQALKSSMASKIGLLNPVTLMRDPRHPDRFICLAGRDRIAAARELGWLSISATVHHISNEYDALLLALVENAGRRTFSSYELAAQVEVIVRKFKTIITMQDISKLLGYSATHLYSLLRFLSCLPANVVEDWRRQHPLLTIRTLTRLSEEPDPSAAWERLRSRFALSENRSPALPSEAASDDTTGWTEFRRPSRARIQRLIDIVSRAKMPCEPEKIRELVVGCLNWARGVASSVPHVQAPPLKRQRPRRAAPVPDPEQSA